MKGKLLHRFFALALFSSFGMHLLVPSMALAGDTNITQNAEQIINYFGPSSQSDTPQQAPQAKPIASYTGTFLAAASSVFDLQRNSKYYSVDASQVVDGNIETAWNEGASGNGIGEWIQIWPADNGRYVYAGFHIANGFQWGQSPPGDRFYANLRVETIHVYADDDYIGSFSLKDERGYQSCAFDSEVTANALRFVIGSVYGSTTHNDACISEIIPY